MAKQPAVYIPASKRNGTFYIGVTEISNSALGNTKTIWWGVHEEIRGLPAGLLRVTRRHDVSDKTREATEEMKPGLEAGTGREAKSRVGEFMGRNYLRRQITGFPLSRE